MKDLIPQKLNMLAEELDGRLYVVGGTCRNFLAGLSGGSTDWDICAPVPPEELTEAADRCGLSVVAVYPRTGTVRLSDDGQSFEFAAFRTDRYVRGLHTPEEIAFTDDIALDSGRRDFKCNAVYFNITEGRFYDPLGGMADIANRRLSTVAPSDKVFGEDGLRLMRLCRFAAELGFAPDEECLDGAKKHAPLIADIAPERVYAELDALLRADKKYANADGHYEGLRLMRDTGVMRVLFPELALGDGMAQRPDFHSHDVLEHTLRCVRYAPESIRLAALLHDVGKPKCLIENGSFARHEEAGEGIAEDILRRLRAPSRVISRVCALVRWHMYDFACQARPNKIRKFIVNHGDIWDDLLALKQADYSACKDDFSPAPGVVRWKKIYADMLKEGAPLNIKQLAVRGDELIAAGVRPADTAGTLHALLEECAINPALNQRQKLIRLALGKKCQQN